MEKEEILRLIEDGLPVEIPAVFVDFLCFLFAVGDDQPLSIALPQGTGRVYLLGVYAAGDPEDSFILFQLFDDLPVGAKLLEGLDKCLHAAPLISHNSSVPELL